MQPEKEIVIKQLWWALANFWGRKGILSQQINCNFNIFSKIPNWKFCLITVQVLCIWQDFSRIFKNLSHYDKNSWATFKIINFAEQEFLRNSKYSQELLSILGKPYYCVPILYQGTFICNNLSQLLFKKCHLKHNKAYLSICKRQCNCSALQHCPLIERIWECKCAKVQKLILQHKWAAACQFILIQFSQFIKIKQTTYIEQTVCFHYWHFCSTSNKH